MAITETISLSRFRDYFFGSDQYKNNFTYEGLEALYNYLWEYSQDINMDIEMDYVSFACEFSEYEDFKHFQEDYKDIGNMDDLEYQTTVIKIPNSLGFIIANFQLAIFFMYVFILYSKCAKGRREYFIQFFNATLCTFYEAQVN